ncbi:MAG: VOC family protein [Oculatellaceae cyanobacterium bins.114]|nr:VOC family protein [Oculatellaceae cyanobacterium bins.114]
MHPRSTKPLKRTFLSLAVAVAIGLAPQSRVNSQTESQRQVISAPIAQVPTQSTVQAVASVGITVSNMDRALEFYTQVLPFRQISDVEVWGSEYEHLEGVFGGRIRVVQLQLGREVIELRDYLTPEGRPIPVDSRSNDRWFQHIAIVVSDMDQAYQLLRQHNVQHVSTAPQRLPDYLTAAAGIEAFYFRDPDGHNLEIIHYPSGKGDPRWQQATDQLFLGIDHTAIAVSNTATSLMFYRDGLGLQVSGASENYGTEQEHLNNVFGARLQISGLRASVGPGIEFLEYLTPSDGRSIPLDTRANDLVHWQTTLIVNNAAAVAQRLRERGYALISSNVIEIPNPALGFARGFLVRDPDGHVMRIVER